jgi:2-polyprenyl-3-methyl-5-hydroxy-6-metoxy-1,4-benzoquinol methylase
MTTFRTNREIVHGERLAQRDPELVWGWKTPAGRLRAIRRAELISSGARLGPGVLALEIGCGTGLFTEMFGQTGAQIVALDISAELLEKARSRGIPPNKVQFLEKRFEDSDIGGPFDAVIGSSVLHHLDLEVALERIFDLLKPGGVMSFAEPNMLNPQILIQKNVPWIKKRFGDSPNETAFVRWRIRSLLLRAGFEKVEVTPFDWLHPATPVALMRTVRSLGGILERIPVMCEFAGSLHIRCYRPQKS